MIRVLEGLSDYEATLAQMRAFTESRTDDTPDELWFLQHPRVFTQGQAGKAEHLLMPGDIPVIASNRGGQVTYHAPGQIVVYVLMNLHRAGYGIRTLVGRIENALIATLARYGISAYADPDARGVYVDIDGVRHKIASLGLRVSRGCSYHGLALNTDMDLEPFGRINPCGYQGLQVTQVRDLGGPALPQVRADLECELLNELAKPAD
ncbi:lipoyl(octanoyl) transferase LipB [Hydrocarboniphaga sp.]|uniref:lipoyl(octanoyl) transferase LipB n=1 Tax=Hydrocarboniphaga sp. TaxID=2033016 RepID=UPI003D0E5051